MNEEARSALEDPSYRARMVEYGKALSAHLDPVWERELGSQNPPRR
jgi:hypothetical protein